MGKSLYKEGNFRHQFKIHKRGYLYILFSPFCFYFFFRILNHSYLEPDRMVSKVLSCNMAG
jgi:hypothetical protein